MSFKIHLLLRKPGSDIQLGHINFGEDWISVIGVGTGEQGVGDGSP